MAGVISEGRELVKKLREIGRSFVTQPKGVFATIDETIVAFRTAATNIRKRVLRRG